MNDEIFLGKELTDNQQINQKEFQKFIEGILADLKKKKARSDDQAKTERMSHEKTKKE